MFTSSLALCATTIALATLPPLPAVIGCMFVSGFALTRFFLALKTRIAGLHPGRLGSVQATVTTLEFVGFVLPLIAGTLADAFGVQYGMWFYAAMGVLLVRDGARR